MSNARLFRLLCSTCQRFLLILLDKYYTFAIRDTHATIDTNYIDLSTLRVVRSYFFINWIYFCEEFMNLFFFLKKKKKKKKKKKFFWGRRWENFKVCNGKIWFTYFRLTFDPTLVENVTFWMSKCRFKSH